MKGKQKMSLTYESVLEAIDQYVNAHLRDEAQVDVVQWSAPYGNGQPGTQGIDIELSPHGAAESESDDPI